MHWKNFDVFLSKCKKAGIKKIYITGQNVDSLQYIHLKSLVSFLQNIGFQVGFRTNGYLAPAMLDLINSCELSCGYSFHTRDPETNYKMLGKRELPMIDYLMLHTERPRVSIVVTRYNHKEILGLIKYFSKFPNLRYIQLRKVSTDFRKKELAEDARVYELLHEFVRTHYKKKREFYGADIYDISGTEVTMWPTVQTDVNSFNYFTDGTVSEEYFIIEGYIKNSETLLNKRRNF